MSSATTDHPTVTAQRARGSGLLLAVLCGVQFIDAFDVASMGPALPEIQRDLGMSAGALQWVVTAYVLGYGGFLLLGGRLADLFDRRRLLLGALGLFIAASVVGGLSTSGEVLIGARFVKGLSAAFTAPASFAILLSLYRDENERNKALGTFISISSFGFISGLIGGGALASGSWRLVLFVPAALALLLLVCGGRLIPRSEKRSRGQRSDVDVAGAVTVTAGLVALVFGVSRSASHGWTDASTIAGLATGAVLLLAFTQIERIRRSPLVPLGIFARPGLTRGNVVIFLMQGAYVGWQFIATLYLQNVNGWSPVEVGLVFAPGGLMVLLTAPYWAGQVAKRGAWPIAAAGMALMVVGTVWTLALGEWSSLLVFGVGTAITGLGFAMVFPAANISAVAGARPEEQGLASGLFIACLQIGSGVILAVVATVFGTGPHTGPESYRDGITAAAVVAAVALVVCVMSLRGRSRTPSSPAGPEQAVEPGAVTA